MIDEPQHWLSERYAPGAAEHEIRADLRALDDACRALSASADVAIAVVDATWLPEDELLSTRFVGTRPAVVAAHDIARTPFDRLTRVIELTGPDSSSTSTTSSGSAT